MRRISIFLFIAVSCSVAAHGQHKTLGKKRPDWGIRSGVNLSTLDMNDAFSDIKWRTGFVAGAFFRIHPITTFTIQPEFLFSSMGANTTHAVDGKIVYRINYFSIPVMGKYMLASRWAAVAGPQFDFLLQARQIYSDEESTRTTNNYKDHSINVTAGIEFWPVNDLGLSARYIYGLTDIVNSGNSVKNQGVQITLGVRL